MVVRPEKFSNDLMGFYLSGYLISELRDIFTQREKEQFFSKSPASKVSNAPKCYAGWPICYKDIEKRKCTLQHSVTIFRSEFVLSNLQSDYFTKKKQALEGKFGGGPDNNGSTTDQDSFRATNKRPSFASRLANNVQSRQMKLENDDNDGHISEGELLMVRQAHICDCKDEQKDKHLHEFRMMLSKQIANYSVSDYAVSSPAGKRTSRISSDSIYTDRGMGLFRKKSTLNSKLGSNVAKDGSSKSRSKQLTSKEGTGKSSSNQHESDEEFPCDAGRYL